jgi:hypothetical protein
MLPDCITFFCLNRDVGDYWDYWDAYGANYPF